MDIAGSNVTGQVAEGLKRNWLSVEINADYVAGSKLRFGDAAASITPRKQQRLWAAGQAYAARFKSPPRMRIDVLAYNSGLQGAPLWIKNALG